MENNFKKNGKEKTIKRFEKNREELDKNFNSLEIIRKGFEKNFKSIRNGFKKMSKRIRK